MMLMLWKREFKEKPEIVLSREMNGRMVKGHITNKIGESAVDVGIEELADLTGKKTRDKGTGTLSLRHIYATMYLGGEKYAKVCTKKE